LFGQPVLTWWQGNLDYGIGQGVDVVYNSDYQQIATVKAANGLNADLHEFLVTNSGNAYIAAASAVYVPGIPMPTFDAVVQEIDIPTGLLLYEWHALDHIPVGWSYFSSKSAGRFYDPYHLNSVSLDPSGNLLLSMRNTSAVYDVNQTNGQINWELGGKVSTFRMGTGTTTWEQHDAIVQPNGTLTLFDDGAGPPQVHPFSRGVREKINSKTKTATLVQQFEHSPAVSSDFEGSFQVMPNGDALIGWGQQPYISEYTPFGVQDFDAHFNVPTSTYRVYRFRWSSQPPTLPSIALATGKGGTEDVYVSWNGATDVNAWRVLAGNTPTTLAYAGSATKQGFETELAVHSRGPYFAVQAIGYSKQVLATSSVASTLPPPSSGCPPGNPCHKTNESSGPARTAPR
jgi:hypothetical protein